MVGAEQQKLKEYLLGQLTEAEEEQLELRLLTEPDFAEEYDIVVDELTDDYVAGKFAGEELEQMQRHFFTSPERRNKLKFALALKIRKSELNPRKLKESWFRPYLAIAASLLLLVGGFYIWRIRSNDSELNQGLAALQSAFRDERPLESRLSDMSYAPHITTRGKGTGKIDETELSRAWLALVEALRKNPTPAAHHALGKVFLAKEHFDDAIKEFNEALKGDPKNARLYSDLGAAWIEKGRIDRVKEPGKGVEDLGHGLASLNKALELDPNLPEATFNRALVYENLMRQNDANSDWQRYLGLDPASPWASEARQHVNQ